jgi:hypothetical protein
LGDSRDSSLLAQLERELGVRLPEEYWSGLAAHESVVLTGPKTYQGTG